MLKEGALRKMAIYITDRRFTNEACLYGWRFVKGRDFMIKELNEREKMSLSYIYLKDVF